jgi:hypothetical protein
LRASAFSSSVKVEARSIVDFFPQELFEKVKAQVLSLNMGPGGPHFYHPVAGRWLTEINFDDETESEILEIAKKTFGVDTIKRAGFHTARYQKQNGIKPQLWKHVDQSACQYSLDICIEKTVDWQLVADEKTFDEAPNQCIVFCGNDHMHYRPEYPTEDEDKYVTLLFMQFAEPDHWFFSENRSEGFAENSWKNDFKFRAKYGYWAMPDYSNNRPICKCCDYRHVANFEEKYQNEKEYWDSQYSNS